MIKVQIATQNNKITSISIRGHAGSGPYGHDLVCAGVSLVLTGGAGALENINDFEIKLLEGNGLIRLKENNELSTHDEIVLETIKNQLMTVYESYPKLIKIEIL